MLGSFYFRHTSHRLVLNSSRVTLSTLPYPKSSETQAAPDGTPINYPTTHTSSDVSKTDKIETVHPNDILEAKRFEKLTLDAKTSSTLVLPGVPLTPPVRPLATEQQQQPTQEEEHERIPSSRFSAFLRSIRSGSPFFPSNKNLASSVNIATTREHFIPVCTIVFLLENRSTVFL
jgi:hypothetical protein